MPAESTHFKCPCCGQHAPIERLTQEGPFEFEIWVKKLGGKDKLSPEERERRKGHGFHRGSAPGRLDYHQVETDDEMESLIAERISELKEGG